MTQTLGGIRTIAAHSDLNLLRLLRVQWAGAGSAASCQHQLPHSCKSSADFSKLGSRKITVVASEAARDLQTKESQDLGPCPWFPGSRNEQSQGWIKHNESESGHFCLFGCCFSKFISLPHIVDDGKVKPRPFPSLFSSCRKAGVLQTEEFLCSLAPSRPLYDDLENDLILTSLIGFHICRFSAWSI